VYAPLALPLPLVHPQTHLVCLIGHLSSGDHGLIWSETGQMSIMTPNQTVEGHHCRRFSVFHSAHVSHRTCRSRRKDCELFVFSERSVQNRAFRQKFI